MRICPERLLGLRLAPAVLVLLTSSNPGCSAAAPCTWEIAESRVAEPRDTVYEDRDPLRKDPENANRVPGPLGLVAVVRTDKLHHPHIFIEDSRRGTSRQLLPQIASEPRWSPDGTRLACIAWMSPTEPWVLTVVGRDGRGILQPLRGVNVMDFKWSPDSKHFAVTATLPKQPRSVLALVALPRASAVYDTSRVLADYEFDWSPDSRLLAIVRPTAIDADEEVTASDLWLMDVTGKRCPLIVGPDFVETAPKWIDSRHLRYMRYRKSDPQRTTEDVVVVLAPAKRK